MGCYNVRQELEKGDFDCEGGSRVRVETLKAARPYRGFTEPCCLYYKHVLHIIIDYIGI